MSSFSWNAVQRTVVCYRYFGTFSVDRSWCISRSCWQPKTLLTNQSMPHNTHASKVSFITVLRSLDLACC